MKRLALYTLSAVLMLAGEPAVGATHHPPPARSTILLGDGAPLDPAETFQGVPNGTDP